MLALYMDELVSAIFVLRLCRSCSCTVVYLIRTLLLWCLHACDVTYTRCCTQKLRRQCILLRRLCWQTQPLHDA